MRVEPFGVGSVVHITQRGARGNALAIDADDNLRFVRSIFYLNDTHMDAYWHRIVKDTPKLIRPSHWPERDPLVHILAWTLLTNHFHLLVQEIREGGAARFMQRLGGSMSMCFNAKYKEKGSLFQGSYHARTVASDEHYQYLAFYILVKNVLEMYPGGLVAAHNNFDDAWEWAKRYPFSSFCDTIAGVESQTFNTESILDDEERLITGIIGTGDAYKQEARELLDFHIATRGEEFKDLMLEPW